MHPSYGVSVDSSVPGEIRITVSQSIGSGETSLCYLCFYAKEALTGTAYVAVSPESTLTNNDGTFLFSECTGLLAEVCLPDFNKDRLTDLRDFALLAKQYGSPLLYL